MNMSRPNVRKMTVHGIAAVVMVAMTQGCAPRQPYRTPIPPSSLSSSTPTVLPAPPPPLETEPVRKPLPQESKIKEQELKPRGPATSPVVKETTKQASITPESSTPALPDDSSLLAKITPGTSPQRAASLRLTDEGRRFLDAGDPAKALTRLEKTIVIDSTNPYGYFYLAKAHYRLGRYKESLNFLDVAESRVSGEPFWLAEVHALRGENFRALGLNQRAEASYAQALRLNSGNRTAAEALARMPGESQPASY